MKNTRCKTIEEKRSTRTWNGGNVFIPDDEQIRKWNKGSGHLMGRFSEETMDSISHSGS